MNGFGPMALTVAVVACVTSLSAQDFDPYGAQRCGFGDGVGETVWKVQNPSGLSDWFSVDFDDALNEKRIVALYCDTAETQGFAGSLDRLGLYPESSAFPNAPQVQKPLLERRDLQVGANEWTGRSGDNAWLVPSRTLPATDLHIAVKFAPRDSHTWVAADTTGTDSGRSYFSGDGYRTAPTSFAVDWMLAAGSYESTEPGTLLINGGSSASFFVYESNRLCLTFFGPALNTPSILYFCLAGQPFAQLLPGSFTVTDGAFAGPVPQTWQVCSPVACNTPTGTNLELCALYIDFLDLRPNGLPKIKQSTSVFLDVQGTCNPGGCDSNFSQADDCIMDGTIWKVQNPSGPSDWFNVNRGAPECSLIQTLTGVSVSSWDFCGFGPCWSEVGLYPANTAVDSTGQTPDVANPIATLIGTSACMAPAASDWGCPLTFYDTADVAARTDVHYHVAARWAAGDTCTWLGSDSDGVDSSWGTPIPSSGRTSLFSTNSYATPAVPFTLANWMMQIDWR